MMAIIALISDLINALIQAIGAISPDAAHAIQQALSRLFDFITSILGWYRIARLKKLKIEFLHMQRKLFRHDAGIVLCDLFFWTSSRRAMPFAV